MQTNGVSSDINADDAGGRGKTKTRGDPLFSFVAGFQLADVAGQHALFQEEADLEEARAEAALSWWHVVRSSVARVVPMLVDHTHYPNRSHERNSKPCDKKRFAW